ncbi:MAG: IS200/IS605 family transposase [Lachnospiraceae bacterium]|nr:IS200/IS605 family transposase [Lachnospiraceae bacterium]
MTKWKSKNRHKYLLQYHIIFVCKYRKKLLASSQISDDIKQLSYEICQKYRVIIKYMETDKDHIHYMIETEPTISISKKHTFWTDGYFACSAGNVSEKV